MRTRFLVVLLLALLSVPGSAQLLINELETGTYDACELWNPTSQPVNLAGWTLSYGAIDPSLVWITRAFPLPSLTVPAGGFVVIRESSITVPAPGALVIDDPQNIPWPTAGPGARGGSAVLIAPGGLGVDAVVWNDPVGVNNLAGASFSGSLVPANAAFGRLSQVDTDTAADWASTPGSLGVLNPAQIPVPELILSATTSGAGDLQWSVISVEPALPGAEIYNFASLEDIEPDGSGIFFGLGLDALPQILIPADPAGIFHTFLDAGGSWSFSFPVGAIPPGLHVELVSIAVTGLAVDRQSQVVSLDF